jgi:arginine N-succinyltransferase
MLNLLPEIVDDCAGRPHDLSAGAMGLLMGAGFEATDLCDIFDGGPAIECKAGATLIAQTKFTPQGFTCGASDQKYLHFTRGSKNAPKTDFRAAIGPADAANQNASNDIAAALGEDIFVSLAADRRGRAK